MLNRSLLLLSLALTASCVAPPVYTDLDPSVDFEAYETFTFLKPSSVAAGPEGMNPMLAGHLERAAAEDLIARGYRASPEGQAPDLVVSFTLGARDRVVETEYPSFYGRGMYEWGGPYYQQTDVRRYTEGTLCIDFFDPARDAPVWHGKTARTVTKKLREDPAKAASAVVSAILERFPRRPVTAAGSAAAGSAAAGSAAAVSAAAGSAAAGSAAAGSAAAGSAAAGSAAAGDGRDA